MKRLKRSLFSWISLQIWLSVSLFLLLGFGPSLALEVGGHLLYFEAQAVGGYSSRLEKGILYSMNPDAEMQKPSLGIDYIQRFSDETGDLATFALQARLALSVDANRGNSKTLEPQLYNAYIKSKFLGPYVWFGHNRPAFGLSSYFDSHGLLLRTLAVQGLGYDRDWGAGAYKDFPWGDLSLSLTTGSGMPILFKGGNYLTAGRIAYGVLSRDNYQGGFSLAFGRALDTMGYELMDSEPRRVRVGGLDFALLRDNLEHRVDLLAGKWLDANTYALSYRLGLNLDPEGRYKIEGQPSYWKRGEARTFELGLGFSVVATSNLTVRLGYFYDYSKMEGERTHDNKVLLQLYYYRPVSWLSKLFGKGTKGSE